MTSNTVSGVFSSTFGDGSSSGVLSGTSFDYLPGTSFFGGSSDEDAATASAIVEASSRSLIDSGYDFHGDTIPIGFGKRLVPGALIWSSQTEVTEYGEEVQPIINFAVAFGYSGIPSDELLATRIMRIWANDVLIYDRTASGSSVGAGLKFTVYSGKETQLADPTILANKGEDYTPAFRGLIYAVFTNFNMANYGFSTVPKISAEISDIVDSKNIAYLSTQISAATKYQNQMAFDWVRNYGFWTYQSGSYTYVCTYDMSNLQQIAEVPVLNSGSPILFSQYHMGYDEVTQRLLFSDPTSNTRKIYLVNPFTGLVTAQFGTNGIGLANTSSSVVATMHSTFVTAGADSKRYLIVGSLFNDLAVFYIGTGDELTMIDYSKEVSHGNISWLHSGQVPNFGVTSYYAGGKAYVADDYAVYGLNIDANQVVTLTQLFTLLSTDRIKYGFYDESLNDIYLIYYSNGLGSTTRAMRWGVTMEWFEGIRVLKKTGTIWDVALPTIGNAAFETGYQFSRVSGGYIGIVGSNSDAYIIDTNDGSYEHIDDLGFYYSTDLNTKISWAWSNDAMVWDGTKNVFYVSPDITGTDPGPLKMSMGIQTDGRIALSDLIRWYALEAGYDEADLDIDPNITETVIGSILTSRYSFSDLITNLGALFQFDFYESDGKIKFTKQMRGDDLSIAATLTEDDLAPISDNSDINGQPSFAVTVKKAGTLPSYVEFRYINYDALYVEDVQTAKRTIYPVSTNVSNQGASLSYAVPIILTASEALELSMKALYSRWESRTAVTMRLPPEFVRLEPSDVVDVTVNSVNYILKVYEGVINADYSLSVSADLYSLEQEITVEAQDPDRPVQYVAGENFSTLYIVDAPLLDTDFPLASDTKIRVYMAIAPLSQGYWSGGKVTATMDGITFGDLFSDSDVPVTGRVIGTLADGMEHTLDEDASISIYIATGSASALTSATEDELLDGANMAYIGDTGRWELVQFKTVTVNTSGTIVLSGLIRGRRGTEYAMSQHVAGDFFLLVEESDQHPRGVILDDTIVDVTARYYAIGNNQATFIDAGKQWTANWNSRKPWSPAGYKAVSVGADRALSWQRRTMQATDIVDGTGDVATDFSTEGYEIDFYLSSGATTPVYTVTGLSTNSYTLTSAEIAAHLTRSDEIYMAVYQTWDGGRGFGVKRTVAVDS